MKTYFLMTLISLALLLTTPSLAADCDEIMAADLNSRIQVNFTLIDSSETKDASEQNKIDVLKQKFVDADKLHSYALENDDQASIEKACDMYQSILDEQEAMNE